MNILRLTLCCLCAAVCYSPVFAQEKETDEVSEQTDQAIEQAKDTVDQLAQQVDESEQAHEISAGILQPIYQVAEHLAFPAFHWIAFAIMATGVVSYGFQLVLGKLALLFRGSLNIAEILSDGLGFVISVVGLVLTTQAAAENSTFTQSPFAVISASVVGLVVGFVFYRWGQAQESEALKGRRAEARRQA